MAITRTNIVDDDGSGTTGTVIDNAWKQQFYNQIDAVAVPVYGSWTPTDVSGAGLALTINSARYAWLDKWVMIWAHITYPATANGAFAAIGSFPFTSANFFQGFNQTYGPPALFHMNPSSAAIALINPTNNLQIPNSTMSGAVLIFSGLYQAV